MLRIFSLSYLCFSIFQIHISDMLKCTTKPF